MTTATLDARIKNLLQIQKDRLSKLGNRPVPKYITNGIFKFEGKDKNINTIHDVGEFVRFTKYLLDIGTNLEKACKMFDLELSENPEFLVYEGFPISCWISDFKFRVTLIRWLEKKKELEDIEKQLASMRSRESVYEDKVTELEKLLVETNTDELKVNEKTGRSFFVSKGVETISQG